MSKIFVSYRHVSPDEGFAHQIASQLRGRGHEVFVDLNMLVGTRWIEEIQSQLTSSQFFLVLLSSQSILSDMVRREIELAHKLSVEKRLIILPIRLNFAGELPYDLAAYLNPIQYAFLHEGQPVASISDSIMAAIERFQPLPERADSKHNLLLNRTQPLTRPTAEAEAPLPAADPRLDTGAMRPDSPFYIRRYADEIADRELRAQGVTVVAKGPRQSGKSSLLARLYALARNKGQGVCYIDFQLLDLADLNTLGILLRCIAWKLSRTFKTKPPEPSQAMLGDKETLTAFIEDAVLSESGPCRVLIFDEVDRIFEFAYRDDFFALIRAWHNRRATQNGWEHLNLVLAHSTDPTLWIQDVNQSPFNVGEHLTLEDFQLSELAELSKRHGLMLDPDNGLRALMQLIGGHPYLARQAFYVLTTRRCHVSYLTEAALDERGPFGDHLRQLGWRLHDNERLRTALRQVLSRHSCDDERDFQRLRAAGLVRGHSSRNAAVRCELYERYFRSLFDRSASSST